MKIKITAVSLFFILIVSMLTGCDVHEFPCPPETASLRLQLSFDTKMTKWHHSYNDKQITDDGFGEIYYNDNEHGIMRYIVRAYPASSQHVDNPSKEFIFYRDIADGYDCELTVDLPAGIYDVMIWADILPTMDVSPYYNASNFAEIVLEGQYAGNTDFRDAFRGTSSARITAETYEHEPFLSVVEMRHPLAKFEFITKDLLEFIDKEAKRLAMSSGKSQILQPPVNINDYRVIFHYSGFMPNAYSIFTDKPVDSATGMQFESRIERINASEATLGFDYVFVNGKESTVSVRIGIYDNVGKCLSLTDAIEVPTKRDAHTILKGEFLMSKASGGVQIDPDFDGDHNIIIP